MPRINWTTESARKQYEKEIQQAEVRYQQRLKWAAEAKPNPVRRQDQYEKRCAKALELRTEGLTFKEIGKRLNVGAQRARVLWAAGLWAAEGRTKILE